MKNEEYWNRRAATYDDQVMISFADAYDKTAERSLPYCKEGDEVLEIACGTGIMTFILAPHVRHITAIDISSEMIDRLREKTGAEDTNITLKHTDVFDPDLDGKYFDVIAAYNVMLYMDDLDGVLSRVSGLLKPGGIFLSATDCIGGLESPEACEKRQRVEKGELSFIGDFTPVQLADMIEAAGLTVLESENLHNDSMPNQFIAAKKSPEY